MKRCLLLKVGFLLAAGGAIAACDREAAGQVAAVVNGEEITLQEVNAELGGAELPDGVDKKAAQKAALQRIVERRLLAQAAREEGLDETPEFLIRQRQLEDAVLVQLLSQRIGRSTKVPDQAAIAAYVEDHKTMFGQRTVYALDRIQFPLPGDLTKLRVLEDDHSMQEVAETLDRMNIQYTRGPAQMDSLQIAPQRLAQIRSLPEGEPFVISEDGVVTIAVITGASSQPITGDQARPLALQAMRNEATADALRQRLSAARSRAEIEYQAGLEPPSASPSGEASSSTRPGE